MKKIFILLTIININVFAQDKYITRTGTVSFEASVPAFEEVAAKNNSVTAILNADNGEFASLVLVKGFRFKNALMEEHFNENYAESDQYPKATFKGTIEKFSKDKLEETTTCFLNGSLIFHGETKLLQEVKLNVIKEKNIITISGSFMVKASEFDIKIPKIVSNKISEEVKVSFHFELQKK